MFHRIEIRGKHLNVLFRIIKRNFFWNSKCEFTSLCKSKLQFEEKGESRALG